MGYWGDSGDVSLSRVEECILYGAVSVNCESANKDMYQITRRDS